MRMGRGEGVREGTNVGECRWSIARRDEKGEMKKVMRDLRFWFDDLVRAILREMKVSREMKGCERVWIFKYGTGSNLQVW